MLLISWQQSSVCVSISFSFIIQILCFFLLITKIAAAAMPITAKAEAPLSPVFGEFVFVFAVVVVTTRSRAENLMLLSLAYRSAKVPLYP